VHPAATILAKAMTATLVEQLFYIASTSATFEKVFREWGSLYASSQRVT